MRICMNGSCWRKNWPQVDAEELKPRAHYRRLTNLFSDFQPAAAGVRVETCLYLHFDAFLARGCGRQNRAWGGASAEPQVDGVSTHQARGAGGSFLSCALPIKWLWRHFGEWVDGSEKIV